MIDATELVDVRISADGRRLRLRARDGGGKTVSFSIPVGWLDALLSAVPRAATPATVQTLSSWSMQRIGDSRDVVLTLRTPQGRPVSFAMKSSQVEAMAAIATCGPPREQSKQHPPLVRPPRTLH